MKTNIPIKINITFTEEENKVTIKMRKRNDRGRSRKKSEEGRSRKKSEEGRSRKKSEEGSAKDNMLSFTIKQHHPTYILSFFCVFFYSLIHFSVYFYFSFHGHLWRSWVPVKNHYSVAMWRVVQVTSYLYDFFENQ